MFNPLLENLSSIKDPDLETMYSDLNKKYTTCLKLNNSALAHQVVVAITMVREELQQRQQAATKKLMDKQNKDIDGLINIG